MANANLVVTNVDDKTKSGIVFRKTTTPTSGQPLVLIMGYGGSLRIWPTSFVARLAQKYTVISYDNRGTGLSVVPQDPAEYTIKAMSDDLDEVLQQLHLNKFHLFGYSMGGCIAIQYAHDHGEKVQTLTLLSSTAGGALYVKPSPEMSAQLANPQGKTLFDVYIATFELMYSPMAMERCMPTLKSIYENSKDTPTTRIGLQGHSNAFKCFDGTSYLSSLHMPTLLIAGADDCLMPPENSKNLAKGIANARLVLIPECQHGAHVQEPNTVIKEIEQTCR